MFILASILRLLRSWVSGNVDLAMENMALRQQLAVTDRQVKRPKLRGRYRLFWTCLSQLWPSWRSALAIVEQDTVIRWHRQGFRLYWARKSKKTRPPGRPKIDLEVRELIGRMSSENPTWGVRRIRDELALLGHELSLATVCKYVDRSGKPPSQTWRSFLENYAADIVAIACPRKIACPNDSDRPRSCSPGLSPDDWPQQVSIRSDTALPHLHFGARMGFLVRDRPWPFPFNSHEKEVSIFYSLRACLPEIPPPHRSQVPEGERSRPEGLHLYSLFAPLQRSAIRPLSRF